MLWKPLRLPTEENILLANLFLAVNVDLKKSSQKIVLWGWNFLHAIEDHQQNNVLIYAIFTDNWFF